MSPLLRLPLPWIRRTPPPLEIVGKQVSLRPLVIEDAEAFFSYAGDVDVTRFLPWNPAPHIESVRPFLAEEMWRGRRGDSLRLAVVLRETGAVIGSTDLVDLQGAKKNGRAELGYLLAKAFWGRGLMTEAAGLTMQYGFETLKLAQIAAFADSENGASLRVLEKIGMRHAGDENRTVKGEERLYRKYICERFPRPCP